MMRSNAQKRRAMKSINEVTDKMLADMKPGPARPPRPTPVIVQGKPLYSYQDYEIETFAASCPRCGGIGYLRKGDYEPGDRDFGRYIHCPDCLEWTQEQARRETWEKFREFIERTDCLQGDLLRCVFSRKKDDPEDVNDFKAATPTLQSIRDAVHGWATRVYSQQDGRRWLYICGACGCGKTHLCAAAANGLRAAGVSVLFMTTPVLLGTLKADLNRTEDFVNQLSVVPVLVLDDLGTEPLTEWAASILFRIIDGRYTTRRPLLVSSNLTLERLGSDRLASRLGDVRLCEVIVNPAPDWRKGAK